MSGTSSAASANPHSSCDLDSLRAFAWIIGKSDLPSVDGRSAVRGVQVTPWRRRRLRYAAPVAGREGVTWASSVPG